MAKQKTCKHKFIKASENDTYFPEGNRDFLKTHHLFLFCEKCGNMVVQRYKYLAEKL